MKKYFKYLLVLAVAAMSFGFYQYNKPHKNMETASALFTMQAADLFVAFDENESAAQEKYLDKVIQVSGEIAEVSQKEDGSQTITLKSDHLLFGVLCEMDALSETSVDTWKAGDEITLKGICTGMLSDVVLVRCVIL